jgi:hypothetical protein
MQRSKYRLTSILSREATFTRGQRGSDGGTSHQHPSSKASGSGIRANPHIMDPNATSCREVSAGRPEKRRGLVSLRRWTGTAGTFLDATHNCLILRHVRSWTNEERKIATVQMQAAIMTPIGGGDGIMHVARRFVLWVRRRPCTDRHLRLSLHLLTGTHEQRRVKESQ